MWMEEDADKRVNQIRAKEIAETGCDTVAVGCPFCSIMVKDGLDSVGAEMDVKDVAEILWEQIVARDEEIQAAAATNAPENQVLNSKMVQSQLQHLSILVH